MNSMTEFRIIDGRIMDKESEYLEFKSCKKALSNDFWPTYSAFANTFGGTVMMGVDDDTGELIGVDNPEKVTKELWDLLNDNRKVNVNLLSPNDVIKKEISGKTVIEVHVPRAERRRRPVYINGTMDRGTYKRNGQGDYHCSISELQQMLRDASDTSHDSEVIERMSIDDLDPQSIQSYRKRIASRNPTHPWNDKDDKDFLRLTGACSKAEDGLMHPTLAGLLMFGYDYSIMSIIPNYHLDYLEFPDDSENWTYRLTTGTGEFVGNVYNFLIGMVNRLMVMNRRGKDLDGAERVDDSLIIKAQRELAVNALIHADYEGLRGIRVEWRESTFSVRNPGNLRIPLDEMLEGGISDPRNPRLALMLGLIGMVERAGSGVIDVVSACRASGMPDPIYKETIEPETVTVRLITRSANESVELEKLITDMMRRDPSVSLDSISERTGVGRSRVARLVNDMKEGKIVERVGGTRGRWMVNGNR